MPEPTHLPRLASAGLCWVWLGACAPVSLPLGVAPSAELTARYSSAAEPTKPELVPALPTGQVTLEEALAAALLHNPGLKTFAWELRAREAEALQAGLYPNPQVSLSSEELAGSGTRRGVGAAISALTLSQAIPLSHRRHWAAEARRRSAKVLSWDYEQARLELFTQTTQAYGRVLEAHALVAFAQDSLRLDRELQLSVEALVSAGQKAPVDSHRTQLRVHQAEIAVEQAERRLDRAKLRLAQMWGSRKIEFDGVVGQLWTSFELPPAEQIMVLGRSSPYVARFADELSQAEGEIEAERAAAVPDLQVGLGVQHFAENQDVALSASLTMDVPVFDRNQGAIAAARLRKQGLKAGQLASQRDYTVLLNDAYLRLAAARALSKSLEGRVLPAAQEALSLVRTSYQAGKVGLLDYIDAQRVLLAARQQGLRARADFFDAVAQIEGLLGAPIARGRFDSSRRE